MKITINALEGKKVFQNTFYANAAKPDFTGNLLTISSALLFGVLLFSVLSNQSTTAKILSTVIAFAVLAITVLYNKKFVDYRREQEDVYINEKSMTIEQGDTIINLANAHAEYNIYELKYSGYESIRKGVLKFSSGIDTIIFRVDSKQCVEITDYIKDNIGFEVKYNKNLRR